MHCNGIIEQGMSAIDPDDSKIYGPNKLKRYW